MGVPSYIFYLLMAGLVVFLIFTAAFVVELLTKNSQKSNSGAYVQKRRKEEDVDIDSMLQRLEKKTTISKIQETNNEVVEKKEPKIEPVFKRPVENKTEEQEVDFDAIFAKLEREVKESREKEEKAELIKREAEEKAAAEQRAKEEAEKLAKEEAERKARQEAERVANEEKKNEIVVETAEAIIEPKNNSSQSTSMQQVVSTNEVTTTVETQEYIIKSSQSSKAVSDFDYQARFDALKDSLEKCEKDLSKATKEVNKYAKTEKRKARTELLLDKKAGELTNLNLVLYNVNDIKEIDPAKKEKQEDLSKHIAELKETIKDANEFLSANKEKHNNAVKIQQFLTKEKARQEDEIKELEILIVEAKKKNKK